MTSLFSKRFTRRSTDVGMVREEHSLVRRGSILSLNSFKGMSLGKEPDIKTRPAGSLEAYAAAQYDLNINAGVMVSATYVHISSREGILPDSLKSVESMMTKSKVFRAMRKVIAEHSNLATVVKKYSNEKYYLELLSTVELENHITMMERPMNEQEYVNRQKSLYRQREFANMNEVPPWRLIVSPRVKEKNVIFVDGMDITLYLHGSLGDAKSGKIVLQSILNALNTVEEENEIRQFSGLSDDDKISSSTVYVPPTAAVFKNVEKVVKFPQSIKSIAKGISKELGLTKQRGVWTGESIPSTQQNSKFLETKMERIKVPAHKMQALVNECHRQQSSLTSLLTSLASISLSESLNSSDATSRSTQIKLSIPINLRPYISACANPHQRMGTYAASLEIPINRAQIAGALNGHNGIRRTETSLSCYSEPGYNLPTQECTGTATNDTSISSVAPSVVWTNARNIKERLENRKDSQTRDLSVGFLRYIGDFRRHLIEKAGRTREVSLQVSCLSMNNLASSSLLSTPLSSSSSHAQSHRSSFTMGYPESGSQSHRRNVSAATQATLTPGPIWTMSDFGYSQSPSAIGAPLTLSMVSQQGGDMMVTFTWAQEVMDNRLAQLTIENFQQVLEEVWLESV